MSTYDERIEHVVKNTETVRAPRQHLSTFGTTNIHYYLVAEAACSELVNGPPDTVIREGRVIAQKPRIVTPYYLAHLEGFSNDARKYFEGLMSEHGPNVPGLLYSYRNEPKELSIVSNNLPSVLEKLNGEIDKRNDPLAAIIKGVDELWDVSILKFIFEMTHSSISANVNQMRARGLLEIDPAGVPAEVRQNIDRLFQLVVSGEREPRELKDELDRWGLFSQYEDKFFTLFQKR